jgi:hypothetical protein
MRGSDKQIKWATEIQAKYNHMVETFGGEKIECDDAKFWIEYGQVTNISYGNLPVIFEAYSFLKGENFIDKNSLRAQSSAGLISRDAAQIILRGEVK